MLLRHLASANLNTPTFIATSVCILPCPSSLCKTKGGEYIDCILLQNNSPFMANPVPQIINGVSDAYSKQSFNGNSSAAVTNLTPPPFAGEDYAFVANSICASTCSIFSSYLVQKHGVRSAVASSAVSQCSEIPDCDSIIAELRFAGLHSDPAAPHPFPVST
ncbi:hypothetical protein B0H12DRAFT_206664 [Mycena haematopus]|nr:hypothetical protein B0H12DRAFT_206664 [Mycena haematopus]